MMLSIPALNIPALNFSARRQEADLAVHALKGKADSYRHVVIVGTGGSSLGAKMLVQLANTMGVNARQFYFLEAPNSPDLARVMALRTYDDVLFLFISKSGGTLETYALTETIIAHIKGQGGTLYARVVTEEKDSAMKALALREGIETLPHAFDVGGRFSVTTLVGLLPAVLAGLDPHKILDGAEAYLHPPLTPPASGGGIENNTPPAGGGGAQMLHHSDTASWHLAAHKAGARQCVMVTYAPELEMLVDWWRQLWGESLGKKGYFTTPIKALGPVDQHSQLQLWMEGMDEQYFLFVSGPVHTKPALPTLYGGAFEYLSQKPLSAITDALKIGTMQSLKEAGRNVRELAFEAFDEATMGQMIAHFMCETVAVADQLGIDPFDQPGVEAGKVIAKRLLKG